eukprot:g5489.t1
MAAPAQGTWVPLQRDYALERTMRNVGGVPTLDHPLQQKGKKKQGKVVAVKSDADAEMAGADEAKGTDELDPLSPAAAASVSDDPLSMSLSAAADDPLSSMAASASGGKAGSAADDERKFAEAQAQEELDEPWDVAKKAILAEYSVGKIKVKASFLDSPADAAEENKPVSMEKSKERLDALIGAKPEDTRELSQKEYMDHIQNMHTQLITAWNTSEKVLSLKLAIQCAKLLSDMDVPHFYPSMFVLVSDILDTFGTLVFDRIKARSEEVLTAAAGGARRVLPEGWTSKDVPIEAKETCRNWFYKVACIRELLPRLYLELSLLRCFRFLSDNEYPQVISRLSCMIRGVGDPVTAAFARVYMSRSADMVAAMGCETMAVQDKARPSASAASGGGGRGGRGCSKHTLGALYDFMFTLKDFEDMKLAAYSEAIGIDRAQIMHLLSPAVGWMMRVVGNGAGKDVFTPVMQHYRGYAPNLMMLRHILASFSPQLWVGNAVAVVNLIQEASPANFTQAQVLQVFAQKCMHCAPPAAQRLPLLNDAWGMARREENLAKYVGCAARWIELLLRHYSDREVLILLRDLVLHLRADPAACESPEVLRPLEDVVHAILEHSSDFGTLLTSDQFVTIMGLFTSDRKTDVCKTLLDQFAKRPTPTGDIVLINSVFEMARSLHDSVDSLSEAGERRHVARLLAGFIEKIDFGADLEQQLNTYVDCRAAFSNLDSVKDRLVLAVSRLAVRAHGFMNGRHTRKTSAFVKACLAYCHITIPSIDSVFKRLYLQLLCGNVALLNACLPQADTFFKGAISLIPEVPPTEEIDYKPQSTEPRLVQFIQQFCSALVMVPGHPQHGPFYLVRGLLNAVQRVQWNPATGARVRVSLAVLNALAVFAQSTFPYMVAGVDSNDTLYGGNEEYRTELNTYVERVMDDTMAQLASLGGEGGSKSQQVLLVVELVNFVLASMQLSTGAIQLTGKLLQLVANNKQHLLPADQPFLANTVAMIRLRAAKAAKARVAGTQDKGFQKLAIACKKLGF